MGQEQPDPIDGSNLNFRVRSPVPATPKPSRTKQTQTDSFYDVAQICFNGHLLTGKATSGQAKHRNFCNRCGAKAITECQKCQTPIPGYPKVTWTTPPKIREAAYCTGCGKPFPWTQAKIKAAKVLIRESDELTDEQKQELDNTLKDIVRDTPQTDVAVSRVKRMLSTLATGGKELVWKVAIDVGTEAAKKGMGL